jgi:O-antigen/teichoic acid export membrane protein
VKRLDDLGGVDAMADGAIVDAPGGQAVTVARNVSTRYVAIAVEAALGLVILPFNVAHLGASAYGLWMLTASVTAYFSVLDLGYSGALVKFVAEYRARRDTKALNEILSTLFVLFTGFGVLVYLAAIAVAFNLGTFFKLSPEQVATGRVVLLVISVNVALGMAFSVFGGVINGFQRYDLNNLVGALSSVATALVNVLVLWMGFGLVELVTATTAVRVLTYVIYRANAYRVFPALQIRASHFSPSRLREVTSFSVYMLLIDWANKLNFSVDALVIGFSMGTTAVAVWTVAERIAEATQRLTNQLNDVLFPAIVNDDVTARNERLQRIFIQGTRLSLATVVPLGVAIALMAGPLVHAWVGDEFAAAVLLVQLLSFVVIVRVGNATGGTLLKGAGRHRLLAFGNVSAAIANLGLSLLLVRMIGLPGVAIGTMVPVAVVAVLVIFPAACARVGISVATGVRSAVWPAVWPAAVMAGVNRATVDLFPPTLIAVGAQIVLALAVYWTTFVLFSLSAEERQFYLTKVLQLRTGWRVAASEGA